MEWKRRSYKDWLNDPATLKDRQSRYGPSGKPPKATRRKMTAEERRRYFGRP